MSEINTRIAEVIRASGLTKTAFAERINVSQQHISRLAKDGTPSDRTIVDICREFGVNERWLRTGEGEMLMHLSREEAVKATYLKRPELLERSPLTEKDLAIIHKLEEKEDKK